MITQLRLKRFKSFADATLELGPFTLLVGTNASGKSNLRDAFRLLHGIGRGYTLAEIIGEKRSEGEKIWGGIRGGTRGLAFQDAETFALEVSFTIKDPLDPSMIRNAEYCIEIAPGGKIPVILKEKLAVEGYNRAIHNSQAVFTASRLASYEVDFGVGASFYNSHEQLIWPTFPDYQPVLSQLAEKVLEVESLSYLRPVLTHSLDALKNMRFLDPNPDAMRQPATPGQTILSDRGENLAAVLYSIVNDPHQKETFIEWLQELTPMDATDFEFPSDPAGRVLLTLVEAHGQRISAYSASDGTLRFLALLAALLGPQPARFHFFEELESGIHPTRLRLLLSLIEQRVSRNDIQVVASTHSPQLLLMLEPDTLEHVSLCYRLENQPDTRIKKLLDLPNARHLVETQDVARLHESGWLEDAVEFMEDAASATQPVAGEHSR